MATNETTNQNTLTAQDDENSPHRETVGETTLVNVNEVDDEDVTPIGRSTRFGNPFRLKKDGGDYTREESVERYRGLFAEKIGESRREEREALRNGRDLSSVDSFRQAVEGLRGETIGCYCVPDGCHGHVILEYLEKTADE